jgi:hypothetical protein
MITFSYLSAKPAAKSKGPALKTPVSTRLVLFALSLAYFYLLALSFLISFAFLPFGAHVDALLTL